MTQKAKTYKAVIGLGKTGFSCVRYFVSKGVSVEVFDTRAEPPYLKQLKEEFPNVVIHLGAFDANALILADEIILSPGVALSEPAIQKAVVKGVSVIGDIELFCREINAPVVAITGSNGKSTVTTLVGEMAKAAGKQVGVGGNIGTPVLELLTGDDKQLYVLELSSFQLETIQSLSPVVATILNISPDHMDRYDSLDSYIAAKKRIYLNANLAVANSEDKATYPEADFTNNVVSFGLSRSSESQYWLDSSKPDALIMFDDMAIMPVSALKMKGGHSVLNAMAAMALATAVGVDEEAMLAVLKVFPGLKHRCQWVRTLNGVDYFNDSKGTNVGASVAAIDGLGLGLTDSHKIVLIAGGVGKGADFSQLAEAVCRYVKAVVLIGEDALKIRSALEQYAGDIEFVEADNLKNAVEEGSRLANEGDVVLFSPACASFDMFKNFEHRGDVFIGAVEELAA